MVERRADGSRWSTWWAGREFCGLRIAVGPGVFVPGGAPSSWSARRGPAGPRTGAPAASLRSSTLCCGSGAVGVAVAAALGGARLHAADIDPAAVACARRNVLGRGAGVPGRPVRAAAAGAARARGHPGCQRAVRADREIGLLPAEARDHEPRVALDGGPDGLDVLRRVAAPAAEWLAPGGLLLTEASERQAAAAAASWLAPG